MQDRFEYAIKHAVVGLIMVLIYCVIYVIIAVVEWGFWNIEGIGLISP